MVYSDHNYYYYYYMASIIMKCGCYGYVRVKKLTLRGGFLMPGGVVKLRVGVSTLIGVMRRVGGTVVVLLEGVWQDGTTSGETDLLGDKPRCDGSLS